jgi:NAD(P)-dependent dehydrogenase (short-subunit alcohol dehydrogenase family)
VGSRSGKVVVVTGSSRGIGAGIATLLGSRGVTVYVTGRTVDESRSVDPGTITAVAADINLRGGQGIAVHCDHSKDNQVKALFERVTNEHTVILLPVAASRNVLPARHDQVHDMHQHGIAVLIQGGCSELDQALFRTRL